MTTDKKTMSSLVITSKNKWTRRNLLARIAKSSAATALMPLVPIMEAGAQTGNIVRYVQWFNANASSDNSGFWQTNDGSINFPSGSPYNAFNRHKSHLAVLGNLHLKCAEVPSGTNPHNQTAWACISGDERNTGSSDYSTLDQLISHDLVSRGVKTPYRNLAFGFKNPLQNNHPIPIDQGKRATVDYDPRAVYDRLFKAAKSLGDTSLAQKKSVLDHVSGSLNKLRPIVSQQDREKLDFHLNSIDEVERRLATIEDGSTCTAFGPEDKLDQAPEEKFGNEIVDAYIDLMVGAFTCDVTRVISYQNSFGHDFHHYSWLGLSGEFHGWTHGKVGQYDNSNISKAEAISRIKKGMTWRHEKISLLMDKLKAVSEPGGTLLDNTGILAWTETSRAHDYNNATWVLAGKMGNKLNTGTYKNYGGAHSNKVLTTIAQAMGMNTNRVGQSKFQSGTLPGLLKS